jgi:hypothetical protein
MATIKVDRNTILTTKSDAKYFVRTEYGWVTYITHYKNRRCARNAYRLHVSAGRNTEWGVI